MKWTTCVLFGTVIAGVSMIDSAVAQGAGSHTWLQRWCGKPYQTGSPNYDPGGQTKPPATSSYQKLHLQVQPRYNIYVDSERSASFLLSAATTRTYGAIYEPGHASDEKFHVTISVRESGLTLIKNARISVNETQVEFLFPICMLEARMKSYQIDATIVSVSGNYSFSATTELFLLPDKTTGSVTKVDNLYGGLLFKNKASNYRFEPVFGVSYFTNYGGWLAQNKSNMQNYYDAGFRTIHPIGGYEQPTSPPYHPLDLEQVWDEADALNMLWVYDMRDVVLNVTEVAIETAAHKDRESLLMWFTADEPDGWQYALNSTKLAYDAIRSIDMYHPVSLVLNCYDFYFKQYTAGADIIMEDTYPISVNTTYSWYWDLPCNSTYGDCGCDDCNGVIQDVSDRLDALATYQTYLGELAKPLYAIPQSFVDGKYWPRLPTPVELWSMNGIAINHNAKSLYAWTYPTDESLIAAHSHYASVVTVAPVLTFLVSANPTAIFVPELPMLDVAYWTVGSQILISFVNGYNATICAFRITLPVDVVELDSQPFGVMDWRLAGSEMQVGGASALEHSMVILNTEMLEVCLSEEIDDDFFS